MPPEETLFVEPRNQVAQQEQPMSQAALCLIGVVSLSSLGVFALVALEVLRPDGYNTAVVGQIIGLLGPSIIGLMVLLRSIANGQATQTVIQKVEHAAGKADIAAGRAHDAAVASAAAPVVAAAAVREVLEKSLPRGPIQVDATLHTDPQPKTPGDK